MSLCSPTSTLDWFRHARDSSLSSSSFFFFIFKFDQTTTFLQTIAARTTEKNRVFVFKAKGDCIAKRTFNLFFSQQRGGHYRRTGVATSRYFARDKLYAPRVPTTKQTEATTVKSDRKSFSSSMRDGLERFSLLQTRGEMFSRFDWSLTLTVLKVPLFFFLSLFNCQPILKFSNVQFFRFLQHFQLLYTCVFIYHCVAYKEYPSIFLMFIIHERKRWLAKQWTSCIYILM